MPYVPSCTEEEEYLKSFDPTKYQNPGVAADTAVFAVKENGVYILLIERGEWPFKGYWALPGGFVNLDEDITDSAKRELKEEAGIDAEYLEQVSVWGKPNRDPRQRVITVSFIALVDPGKVSVKAGDDACKAEWFKIADYKKTVGSAETQIDYVLCGPQNICASVRFPNDQIQQITCIQNGGLAFDHAESIATSTEYLKQRINVIAPLSLGKETSFAISKIISLLIK